MLGAFYKFHSSGVFLKLSHSGRAQRRSLILLRLEVYPSSLTGDSTARLHFVVTMFMVGKTYEDTIYILSAICCIQRCLARRQLLTLQSRTADEKNQWQNRRISRGRSTISPAPKSRKTGAILFGVANWVHIHLKPTSMCGINVLRGGGGGGGAQCAPPPWVLEPKKAWLGEGKGSSEQSAPRIHSFFSGLALNFFKKTSIVTQNRDTPLKMVSIVLVRR